MCVSRTRVPSSQCASAPYSAEEEGCGALWNLAATETNEEAIASNDGIEAVVVAMRTHVAVAGVQEQGDCSCGPSVLCLL
jgi:hypothetical protein